MVSYEVQGRRMEQGLDGKQRHVVRLDRARSTTVAFAIASAMATENLTVWVFETEPRAGKPPAYRLLRVVAS